MRKHHEQIKLWASSEHSEVFVKTSFSSWFSVTTPSWSENYEYKTILPKFRDAWQAYLDGELQYKSCKEWKDWTSENPPNFIANPSFYRRKPHQHPHADLIKRWAENTNCTVWFKTGSLWIHVSRSPKWNENSVYVVIEPEYQDAWKAYLDGKLQFMDSSNKFKDWVEESHPRFDLEPQKYRRKPVE